MLIYVKRLISIEFSRHRLQHNKNMPAKSTIKTLNIPNLLMTQISQKGKKKNIRKRNEIH
jgi:hypothetical protein